MTNVHIPYILKVACRNKVVAMQKGKYFISRVFIFHCYLCILVTVPPLVLGQGRTTTTIKSTTLSLYDALWGTTTTVRSNSISSTPPSEDIVHFINEGGGLRRSTSSTTRRSLPTDSFVDGGLNTSPRSTSRPYSSTTRASWMETSTSTRRPQSDRDWLIGDNSNAGWTTTRRTTYMPTLNNPQLFNDFPLVNFTATDFRKNEFIVKWNGSRNEGTLSVKNLRQLTLIFTCNASHPIEWLSQTPFTEKDAWQVDELRHFEEVLTTSRTSTRSQTSGTFKTIKTIYAVILTLTFDKSEALPDHMILSCATARRAASNRGRGWQTVIRVSKDVDETLHFQVSNDFLRKNQHVAGDSNGNMESQYRRPLGGNTGCLVKLEWVESMNSFKCITEQPWNLTIDYEEDDCYDFATCERTFKENSCWHVWNNPKTKVKGPSDLWLETSSPSAGVVYCRRVQNDTRLEHTDAIHFFYSLPVICPEDNNSSGRHKIHMASELERLPKYELAENFMSFCWTPRSYNGSMIEVYKPVEVYTGENITVTCISSLYHFARGTRIAILTRNQNTAEYAKVTDASTDIRKNQGCFNYTANVHIKSADITGLVCESYLKQSIGFVWKTLAISVRIPRPVNITKRITQISTWNYTGQSNFRLECEVDGEPQPKITWWKDSKPIPDVIHVENFQSSLLGSVLIFPTSHALKRTNYTVEQLHGTYVCEAENRLKDRDQRTFHVTPSNSTLVPVVINPSFQNLEPSSDNSSVILGIVLPIFGVIVFAVISLLVWKIKKQNKELQLLSKAEVDEFLFGKPDLLQHHCSSEEVNNYAPFLPYNTSYEVSKEQIEIDENAVLGSGAYAIVLRGILKRKDGEKIKVAIKSAKTDDVSLFKALLSELKIMGFIGTHPNIVNLIGAHTKNIQNREIFICIELCENSNLLAYLRDHRNQFTNLVNQEDYDFIPGALVSSETLTNPENGLNTVTLIKWAYEIASGMQFLSHKKVIHGDLAARNILLNEHLTAKIGDFGLSRQLFEYANYIKKQQSPLPWKWLAIECLQDMRFSVKSDVWAYGILLYEIFSLGQVPYPGYSYNDEFLEALIDGKRPNRPSHATKSIYAFMETCWKDKSEERPNFTEVHDFFNRLLSTLVPPDYLELHEKINAAVVPAKPMNDADSDIQTIPVLSPNSSSAGSLGMMRREKKEGRFSFNMNAKSITARFHKS